MRTIACVLLFYILAIWSPSQFVYPHADRLADSPVRRHIKHENKAQRTRREVNRQPKCEFDSNVSNIPTYSMKCSIPSLSALFSAKKSFGSLPRIPSNNGSQFPPLSYPPKNSNKYKNIPSKLSQLIQSNMGTTVDLSASQRLAFRKMFAVNQNDDEDDDDDQDDEPDSFEAVNDINISPISNIQLFEYSRLNDKIMMDNIILDKIEPNLINHDDLQNNNNQISENIVPDTLIAPLNTMKELSTTKAISACLNEKVDFFFDSETSNDAPKQLNNEHLKQSIMDAEEPEADDALNNLNDDDDDDDEIKDKLHQMPVTFIESHDTLYDLKSPWRHRSEGAECDFANQTGHVSFAPISPSLPVATISPLLNPCELRQVRTASSHSTRSPLKCKPSRPATSANSKQKDSKIPRPLSRNKQGNFPQITWSASLATVLSNLPLPSPPLPSPTSTDPRYEGMASRASSRGRSGSRAGGFRCTLRQSSSLVDLPLLQARASHGTLASTPTPSQQRLSPASRTGTVTINNHLIQQDCVISKSVNNFISSHSHHATRRPISSLKVPHSSSRRNICSPETSDTQQSGNDNIVVKKKPTLSKSYSSFNSVTSSQKTELRPMAREGTSLSPDVKLGILGLKGTSIYMP